MIFLIVYQLFYNQGSKHHKQDSLKHLEIITAIDEILDNKLNKIKNVAQLTSLKKILKLIKKIK